MNVRTVTVTPDELITASFLTELLTTIRDYRRRGVSQQAILLAVRTYAVDIELDLNDTVLRTTEDKSYE